MKNYRVSATKSGFVIELNTAVSPSQPNIDPENLIYEEQKPETEQQITSHLLLTFKKFCRVLFIKSVENIQFLKA